MTVQDSPIAGQKKVFFLLLLLSTTGLEGLTDWFELFPANQTQETFDQYVRWLSASLLSKQPVRECVLEEWEFILAKAFQCKGTLMCSPSTLPKLLDLFSL